jgi:hypothetical protein
MHTTRNINIRIVLILLAGIVSSCSTPPDRNQMENSILSLEDEVRKLYQSDSSGDDFSTKTLQLRDSYLEFANTWRGDSLSAVFLYQAAMFEAEIHQDVSSGIVYLEQLVEEYAEHPLASTSLFLIGFSYSEQLKNPDKAREAYELYLERYPDGEMRESVAIELKTLRLSK